MKNNEIKTVPFMFDIPTTALELEIKAKVFLQGEVRECTTKLDIEEIRKGMVAGEEWEDANGVWCLTEEAKKELGIE